MIYTNLIMLQLLEDFSSTILRQQMLLYNQISNLSGACNQINKETLHVFIVLTNRTKL